MEVSSQKSDEVSGSKGEKCKFHDVWKSSFFWLIDDSSNNVYLVVSCESLVFLNKSLKHSGD